MSAPDKYVAKARDIFEDPFFRPFRNDHCINEVATALREAEAEGMRRGLEKAAAVVLAGREVQDPHDDYRSTIMVDWNDDEACAEAIMKEAD